MGLTTRKQYQTKPNETQTDSIVSGNIGRAHLGITTTA